MTPKRTRVTIQDHLQGTPSRKEQQVGKNGLSLSTIIHINSKAQVKKNSNATL
jgi:hypothetical protein